MDKKRKIWYTADRIEGDRVVCEAENGDLREFPLDLFEETPSDGTIFCFLNGKAVPDKKKTEARKKQMEERFLSLRKKDR